jgi:hypothetical protein
MRGKSKRKRKKENKENKEKGKTKKIKQGNLHILHLNPAGGVVLPNVFQNGLSSIRKVTPPEEPEPKPFLEEPEPCQTCLKYIQTYTEYISTIFERIFEKERFWVNLFYTRY